MIDGIGEDRDLSVLVVPTVGAVEAGSDPWAPVRLIDSDGGPVVAVMAFLRELQASGRSAATQRSYAMDLLRWFRFGWAIDVGWDLESDDLSMAMGKSSLMARCRSPLVAR
jgi:hypothetical protein